MDSDLELQEEVEVSITVYEEFEEFVPTHVQDFIFTSFGINP